MEPRRLAASVESLSTSLAAAAGELWPKKCRPLKWLAWAFKAKSAKAYSHPITDTGGKNLKSVNHNKYLGAVLDTELSDDKDIQRQLR